MLHTVKKHRTDEGCNPCVTFTPGVFGNQPGENSSQHNVALNGIIKLVVGGIPYMTTYRTLVSHEGSRLAVYFNQFFSQLAAQNLHGNLLNDSFVNITGDANASYPIVFIDRDGTRFSHVLNYLRDGDVAIPEDIALRRGLLQDARYFGLTALENSICKMLDSRDGNICTPRASPKRDLNVHPLTTMAFDCAPKMPDHHHIVNQTQGTVELTRMGSSASLQSPNAMGNPFDDSQSYMFSQRSYDDDLASSQKSLLHVMESDNIEDSGVFFQTTPLSRLGKTEFSTTVDF